ncbi:hypothetical protein AC578_6520 [Pseudocercospora eumusae]|uniref:Uncharacterized protein n=1 Tax=Pseudocercospora eumusae TaxID=321146 RepID=A0A139HHU1_9PEZI|nr:hypothetical protein AC578_6520 [Pseudocercospora eumusae]
MADGSATRLCVADVVCEDVSLGESYMVRGRKEGEKQESARSGLRGSNGTYTGRRGEPDAQDGTQRRSESGDNY